MEGRAEPPTICPPSQWPLPLNSPSLSPPTPPSPHIHPQQPGSSLNPFDGVRAGLGVEPVAHRVLFPPAQNEHTIAAPQQGAPAPRVSPPPPELRDGGQEARAVVAPDRPPRPAEGSQAPSRYPPWGRGSGALRCETAGATGEQPPGPWTRSAGRAGLVVPWVLCSAEAGACRRLQPGALLFCAF